MGEVPGAAADAPPLRRTLYWGSGSPPAWRVLLALTEKGLPFRSEQVSFESGVLRTPPMLSLNPRGLVPIFIDGSVRMYESLAILMYLELTYPEPALLPRDAASRARCLTRMHEANSLSAACGEIVYYVRRTPPADINEAYLSAKRDALWEELSLWESYLVGEGASEACGRGLPRQGQRRRSGARSCRRGCSTNDAHACTHALRLAAVYVAGDAFTLADASFFPNLAYCVRLGLALEGCVCCSHGGMVKGRECVCALFTAGRGFLLFANSSCRRPFPVRRRYPNLFAYMERLTRRPTVLATWPPHWSQSPGLPILS